jgi:hypothetical protein
MNIDIQIKCLQDERKRRLRLYPTLVELGKMSEKKAAFENAALLAAIATLSQLKGMVRNV